ncbi:unnamed protein product [Brachionus calyciflorus]|uniref:GATOR2 complex protein WDR24 n=1 Tax=Brachionus calyciflorus TaxID=104777 RepID=A0A813REA3_9BILA|nr:unnamed protein product [Brachionus calyciflorus]
MAYFDNQEYNSKTFSYGVSFPINSFTLNKDGNRIILAGRSEWELLNIDEDKFTSKSNLNSNLFNMRITDVEWSRLDETLVASCGSNGGLQKLIVSPTDLRIEFRDSHIFHERTINKIHFHPNERSLLFSGGQDGNIKLIDFRSNPLSSASPIVFHQHPDDKVTDLQINPSPSLSNQLVSGSESGYVYFWDTRMANKYEKRYGPFRGIVHIDWHPEEKNWLAVARVDRQISVLDTSTDKLNTIYSITNSESLANIKWRPNRKMQIGACMSGANHYHLYVWDLNRPYVPYASFDSIINKAENFMWRNSPNCIIASTRAQNNRALIYNTYISEAQKPAEYSTLVTVEMDKMGSIAFAVGVENEKKLDSHEIERASLNSDINNDKFLIAQSNLYFNYNEPLARSDWFYYAATNYRFNSGTFEELCDYNSQVALSFDKDFKNWMILKTLYKENDKYDLKEENSSKSTSSLSNSKQVQSYKLLSNENCSTIQIPFSQVTAIGDTSSSDGSEDGTSSSSDIEFDDSPILERNGNPIMANLESNPNSFKLSKESNEKLNTYRQNENIFITKSNNVNTLSQLDNHDEQNFINNSHMTKIEDEEEYSFIHYDNIDNLCDFFKSNHDTENFAYHENEQHYQNNQYLQNNFKSQSDLASSIVQSTKQIDPKDNKHVLNNNNNISGDVETQRLLEDLNNCFENQLGLDDGLKINFDESFCQLLHSYIDDQNDLVTPIFMYLVRSLKKMDKNLIEANYLDEWFVQYIELLAKFELWNQRIEIIKAYRTDVIQNLTQNTLLYTSMCGKCKITIKQDSSICRECKTNVFLCSYCHLPVKRLYAWCHACYHGGHLNHMIKWFKTNTNCPTGCGCTCSPNYNQLEQINDLFPSQNFYNFDSNGAKMVIGVLLSKTLESKLKQKDTKSIDDLLINNSEHLFELAGKKKSQNHQIRKLQKNFILPIDDEKNHV